MTGRREKSGFQAVGAGCHFKRRFQLAKMLRLLCIRPRRLSLNRRNRQVTDDRATRCNGEHSHQRQEARRERGHSPTARKLVRSPATVIRSVQSV